MRQTRTPVTAPATPSDPRPSIPVVRPTQERKSSSTTKTPSQASSSRPSTPAAVLPQRPATPPDVKALRQMKESQAASQPPHSPAPFVAPESDHGNSQWELVSASSAVRPASMEFISSSAPPGLSVPPPGLSAPPGILSPSRPPRVETASPQTPLLASQSSYQMSTAARALLDDVKARRESALPVTTGMSPFPDLDRTLQTLSGADGSGFSFNLDPNLAGDEVDGLNTLTGLETEASAPFHGSYVDAFPALRNPTSVNSSPFMAPPGLPYPHNPNRSIYDSLSRTPPILPAEKQSAGGSSYMGSFNPFADVGDEAPASTPSQLRRQYSPLDDDPSRKVSRFGFARGRQGSTAASSPLHVSSPLSNSTSEGHSFYNSTDTLPQTPQPQRSSQGRPDHTYPHSNSNIGSPHVQYAQTLVYSQQQQSRFQPFEPGVSEAQLRDLIQSSRDRAGSSTGIHNHTSGTAFCCIFFILCSSSSYLHIIYPRPSSAAF